MMGIRHGSGVVYPMSMQNSIMKVERYRSAQGCEYGVYGTSLTVGCRKEGMYRPESLTIV
jgi:hypothetical protein